MRSADEAAGRAATLASIAPADALAHHQRLLSILAAEVEYRRTPDGTFFENIYWCAYLLATIADLGDVEALWAAKHTSFDTACGFDSEALLGAGLEATIRHLEQAGRADIVSHIRATMLSDLDVAAWAEARQRYFYG